MQGFTQLVTQSSQEFSTAVWIVWFLFHVSAAGFNQVIMELRERTRLYIV